MLELISGEKSKIKYFRDKNSRSNTFGGGDFQDRKDTRYNCLLMGRDETKWF